VTKPTPLAENVTIHVHGSVAEDCAVDFQLSGVGPMFTCNVADPSTRFQGNLSTTDDGKLTLEYSMGVSVPVKTVPNTVQYKDFGIQGRVAVSYGEEIKIATVNGKDLVCRGQQVRQGEEVAHSLIAD